MSDFFNDFASGLEDAATQFGKPWSRVPKGGGAAAEYMAIEIETSSEAIQVIAGGKYRDASALVTIFLTVCAESGVVNDDIVLVRGGRYRVNRIDTDDDGTKVLVLTSPQIKF